MDIKIILATFSGTAVATGFFLSIFFLLRKGENLLVYRLSGLLFLGVSLRIGKSTLYFTSDIPDFGVALGFLGLASIGPLCWLLIKSSPSTIPPHSKQDFLHFLFPLLGFVPVWLLQGWWPTYFYWFATFLLGVYLVNCWKAYSVTSFESAISKKWIKLLLASVSLIWMAFVYQHLANDIMPYAMAAAFAALILYRLLFFMLKNPILFPKSNHVKINLRAMKKIKHAFYHEKTFLKHAITVNQFAELIDEPAYIISKTIKVEYGMTFPEFINHLRIENAKSKLTSDYGQEIKIENLAYEVGFNTPSAFYAAFKKDTNLSPKEFQKRAVTI